MNATRHESFEGYVRSANGGQRVERTEGISDGALHCTAYLSDNGLRAATTAGAIADAKHSRLTTVNVLTQVRSAIVPQSLARTQQNGIRSCTVHDR